MYTPPTYRKNFLSLLWKALFGLSQHLLSLSSFANNFWFLTSCCLVRLVYSYLSGIFSFCLVLVCFPSLEVYYDLFLWEFFIPGLANGFSLEFEWQQSAQVSRTLFRILAVPNNALVWTVPTWPLIFKCSCPFVCPCGIVSNAATAICIKINIMFHCLFVFLFSSNV